MMIKSIDSLIKELNDVATFIENAVPAVYEQHEEIGDGHFNQVFRASIDGYPIPLAARNPKSNKANITNLKKSISLLRAMPPHPAIATPLGYVEREHTFSMLLKEVDESLLDHVENRYIQRRPFKAKEIQGLFAQIVFGLDALHQQTVAHRDLKLENIGLRWQDGPLPQLLLLDFDFLPRAPHSVLGTPDYFSPFQLQSKYEKKKTKERTMESVQKDDIWALGIVLIKLFDFTEKQASLEKLRLLVNKTLFSKLSIQGQIFLNQDEKAPQFLMMSNEDFYHERATPSAPLKPFTEELSHLIDELFSNTERTYSAAFRAATKELMMGMLAFNENERLSTADILTTPFIQRYFDSKTKKKTSPIQDAHAFIETELDYSSEAFRPLAESIRQLINQLRFISSTHAMNRSQSGSELSSPTRSDTSIHITNSLQSGSTTASGSLSSIIDLDEDLKNRDFELTTSLQKVNIILLRLTESLHDLASYDETIQLTYYNRIDRLLHEQLRDSVHFLQSLSPTINASVARTHHLIDYMMEILRSKPSAEAIQAFIINPQHRSMLDAIRAVTPDPIPPMPDAIGAAAENLHKVAPPAEEVSPERANQRLNWHFLLSIRSAIGQLKAAPEKAHRAERAQAVFRAALEHVKAHPESLAHPDASKRAFNFLTEKQGDASCSIATALGKKEGLHLFKQQPLRYRNALENAHTVDRKGHFSLDEESYDFFMAQRQEPERSHANRLLCHPGR